MKAAQITVGVQLDKDGNPSLGINFVGDEALLIPLLGGMTHASQWVSNRISNRIGEGAWGNVDGVQQASPVRNKVELHEEKDNEYPTEQTVPKDKAIEATEYAIQVLQQRVDTMKKSPDQATFRIDPSLLAKL
jgi:hypothetical protein